MTESSRRRRYRSLLYVPGTKREWALGAESYGPDGIIIDLEDSVPPASKVLARTICADVLGSYVDREIAVFVRCNAFGSGELIEDLLSVTGLGPAGIFLPKVTSTSDVIALDRILDELEAAHGLPNGSIEIVPVCETPVAIHDRYEICRSSKRVARVGGGPRRSPGGDASAALGIEWTELGLEEVYANAKAVVDAKAAGLCQVFGAPGSEVHDLDSTRTSALRARQFGCFGMIVLHPGQVAVANDVFSPTPEMVAFAKGLLDVVAEAVDRGEGATTYRGKMVDLSHARTALSTLEDAKSFGIDVDIDLTWQDIL